MNYKPRSSELLLLETGTDLADCLYKLSQQGNLRPGQEKMIARVLKDWRDVVHVLTQPTQDMPEPPVPGTEPGSWRNARGVLAPGMEAIPLGFAGTFTATNVGTCSTRPEPTP